MLRAVPRFPPASFLSSSFLSLFFPRQLIDAAEGRSVRNVLYPSSSLAHGSCDECQPLSRDESQVSARPTEDQVIVGNLEDGRRAMSDPPPSVDSPCSRASPALVSSSSSTSIEHVRNLALIGVSPRHAQWSTFLESSRLRDMLARRGRGELSKGRGRRGSG